MRPVSMSRTLVAAVANAIALSQTLGGAGPVLLNGALASGGVATIPAQRRVTITSTSDLTLVNFTIVGTNEAGNAVTEVLAGGSTATVTSVNDYATVTSITASGAVASAITVGTSAIGGSLPVPLDIYLPFGSTVSVALLSGAVNYSVQVTNGDPFGPPANLLWVSYPDAAVVAKAASAAGVTATAWRAVRLLTNSGAGTVQMVVTQQGLIV